MGRGSPLPAHRLATALLLLTFGSVGLLSAQGLSSAAIEATVQDSLGRLVSGAEVEVLNLGTGEQWRPRLSSDGRFVLEHVPPGRYLILVRAVGFQPARLEGLNLTAGDRFKTELVLALIGVGLDEIQVTAVRGTPSEFGSSGPRSVVSVEQIARIPNVQRNLLNLLVTSPQTFRTEHNGWNSALTAFSVDGGQGSDLYSGGYAGAPIFGSPLPLEAISEVATLAAPNDARWGQVSSGVFALTSLRGTNTWSGSAYGTFQNQGMVGKPGDGGEVTPFTSWTTGAVLTGPLIRNRLHLALVADYTRFERADRGAFVTDTANGQPLGPTGVSRESAIRFQQILADTWGLDAGTISASNTVRPRWDLWGKLSLQLGAAGSLDFTQRVANGDESGTMGPAGNRPNAPSPYLTGSTSREDLRQVYETRAVWRVQPKGRWSNELVAGWRSLRDRCASAGAFPRLVTDADQGSLAAGTDSTCSTTDVQQTTIELSEHGTILVGRHLLTGGLHAEWFDVSDPVVVGSQGEWRFGSLDDLAAGRAIRYDRVLPGPLAPAGPEAAFSVRSLGLYLQDRVQLGSRVDLTLGLRADRPSVPQRGHTNPVVESELGLDTGAPPESPVLVSPRFGVVWDVTGRGTTEVRAGGGLFTGRAPYRWLSGIYRGSGGEQSLLSCSGPNVPTFDPSNQPTQCGTGARPIGQNNVYAPGLRLPQTLQLSLGASHQLPSDITLSADLVYGTAVSTFRYTDANLTAPVATAAGEADRPMYGGIGSTGLATTSRLVPALGPVVLVDRGQGDRTYTASLVASRPMLSWWSAEAGYLWTRTEDRQSVTSFDPLLNLGATPLVGTHADRSIAPSVFGATHRFFAVATVQLPLRSTLSLLYVGNTGRPYSYVVDGDANADGLGRSATGFNDLVYVPKDVRPGGDIDLVIPGNLPAPAESYAALDSLINREPCLRDHRGALAGRNICRNGWTSFFNARLQVQVPAVLDHRLEVGVDVFNILNLINDDWGLNRETARGTSVRLLQLVGWNSQASRGVYTLRQLPTPQVNEGLSRWRLQFTSRYRY